MQNPIHPVASHWRTWAPAVLAAVPVIGVNAVAFAGQLGFLREHLPWPLAGQVLVAAVLESVAVYLAYQAHVAQVANDTSLRLRLAAYAFALVIGVMNYSHWAGPGWSPTFAAVAFGLMSASSPWLWSVYSRRRSRDVLLKAGLVEPHALRLGAIRWMWHPVKSWRVMSHATWLGTTDPAAAIGAVYPQTAAVAAVSVLDKVPSSTLAAAEKQLRATIAAGNPLTQNQLQDPDGFDLTRAQARELYIRCGLLPAPRPIASSNGHAPKVEA